MDFGGGARRDTAVHESGHAVARVLSIGRVGITNENAIRWIEMDRGHSTLLRVRATAEHARA